MGNTETVNLVQHSPQRQPRFASNDKSKKVI